MAPSSGEELKNMINFALSINNKPSAIRYPRDLAHEYKNNNKFQKIIIGKGKIIKNGKKIAFLNLGTRLKKVFEISELIKKNYKLDCSIIDMRFAKPIDVKLIQKLTKNHDIFITIEENAIGGFSSQVNDFLINKISNTPKILNFFMKDEFIDQSDIEDQYSKSGISPKIIYEKLIKLLK